MLKGRKGILAIFLLTILTIIWGSSFILMKLGMYDSNLNPTIHPMHVAGLRITLASLVLLPFAIYFLSKMPKNKLLPILGIGFFGNAIPAFLFTASEVNSGISSSLAGMLNATTPIFTVIIGMTLFKLRLKPINYIGIIVAFAGSAALALIPIPGAERNESQLIYILYVLTATFCYGMSVNLIRNYMAGVNAIAITSISFMFIGIPVAIWLFTTQNILSEIHKSPQHITSFYFVAILAVVGTALAVILFNYLVQLTNAVFASTVTYLMPIVAILWGLLSPHAEYFTWWYGVAIAVILGGVYLTNKK
jgi:drug/metabolite transporter (DMT)-like permease